MELDKERSGHTKENILSLTFTGVSADINIELNPENAKELHSFLEEVLEEEQTPKRDGGEDGRDK